jgi:hypothetical protein
MNGCMFTLMKVHNIMTRWDYMRTMNVLFIFNTHVPLIMECENVKVKKVYEMWVAGW